MSPEGWEAVLPSLPTEPQEQIEPQPGAAAAGSKPGQPAQSTLGSIQQGEVPDCRQPAVTARDPDSNH